MRGFVLKTPGKRAATPGRSRGVRPRLESECPPTPRQARDGAADQDFARRGVRTVLAIKPLEAETGATKAEYPILSFDPSARALVTTAPPKAVPGDFTPEHSFDSRYFDQVYQGKALRADLKKELQPIVDCVVGGRSAAVIAYGQTGSGKTYLMEGEPAKQDRAGWGLAPHAIYKVLQAVQKSSGKKFLVSLSYLEVYNETVRDLLDPRPLRKGETAPSLPLKLNADGYYDVSDATSTPVSDVAQALALLQTGGARRAQAATGMNSRSSRSFADVILTVESIDGGGTGAVCCGRLHLVDLAGSERQAQTGAEGGRLKESSSINLALLALRKVVQARSAAQPTLAPYTDSKVTKMLKDALSGDAALLVVCCLSASPVNYQDSLGTLKFAASCRSLTAKPTVRRVSTAQSRITGLSAAVERIRAAEQAAAAERMIGLESRAVAQELELQVAEARLSEARGQIEAGANLALAAQAACEELLLHCAQAVDELVAGQDASSEAAAGLLARHVLPQLDFCLSTPQMLAHVAPSALLRFTKALLQVNFSASHSAADPLASLFDRLLQSGRPKEKSPSPDLGIGRSGGGSQTGFGSLLARTWPGLVTYCGKLINEESSGDSKLPGFVLENMEKAVRAIGRALEVKRFTLPWADSQEAKEALEVSSQLVIALEGKENTLIAARFLGLFRTIIREATPLQRQNLFDLGSPIGFSKPSSPGSWLTPSRTQVRVSSPRAKGTPVRKSASAESPGNASLSEASNRPVARGLSFLIDNSPQSLDGTEKRGVVTRSPLSREERQSPLAKTDQRGKRMTFGTTELTETVEPRVKKNNQPVSREAIGEFLLGEDAKDSPGSWLTPGCVEAKVSARTSRFGGVRMENVSKGGVTESKMEGRGYTAVGTEKTAGVEKEKRTVGPDPGPIGKDLEGSDSCGIGTKRGGSGGGSFSHREHIGTDGVPKNAATNVKIESEKEALDSRRGKRKEASLIGVSGSGGFDKGGVGTGANSYPRKLIGGEWHTPEYMKAKGTVSRKVKTCAREAGGLRTPDDGSASEAMASVKKVLFSDTGERTRGSPGEEHEERTRASRGLETSEGEAEASGRGFLLGRKSSAAGRDVLGSCSPGRSRKSNPGQGVRRSDSTEKRSHAGGLGGALEPRRVLSPLKGARQIGARKPSPFSTQFFGKENTPMSAALVQGKSALKAALLTSPRTSALKPPVLTSPRTALKQALLTSPATSVRPPVSAAKPPRREFSQGLGNTPLFADRNRERNEPNGSSGERNENGASFAQLRGHLQSLRLTGEHGKGSTVLATEIVLDKKGAESSVTTPLAGGAKRATTFLSPALLWTPSDGPSPSLDKLRQRLAGMAGH